MTPRGMMTTHSGCQSSDLTLTLTLPHSRCHCYYDMCYHQNLLLIGTGHNNTKNKKVLITLTLTLTLPHSPCHCYYDMCYHQKLLLIGTGHNTKNKTVLITLTLTLTLPHSPCHYYNVIIYLLIIIICRVVCSIIIYSASLDLHVGQKLIPPLHHRSSMIDLFANIANCRASNSINSVDNLFERFWATLSTLRAP